MIRARIARCVYRFLVRSQPDPFMATLDCADPSQIVEKRGRIDHGAAGAGAAQRPCSWCAWPNTWPRIVSASERPDLEGQIAAAVRADAATPTELPTELQRLTEYAREFGLAEACRLLFNLNEFVFVDCKGGRSPLSLE